MKPDIYDTVTARLISALESGTVPWRKPWNVKTGPPRNASGREYHGINCFLLACLGYADPRFVTFKQALDLGGNVRKGEKGCPVVYWNFFESKTETDSKGNPKRIPFLKGFTVFNVAQCDNLDIEPLSDIESRGEFAALPECEATIAATGAEIRHGFSKAFYTPSTDTVSMPCPESFDTGGEYYSTLFHELSHWTGHKSRLARKGITDGADFGSDTYGKEELIAEMSAAFLCAEHGIDCAMDNSAAYLAGWIRVLKGDSKLAVHAASAATKAADFVMGRYKAAVDTVESEQVEAAAA